MQACYFPVVFSRFPAGEILEQACSGLGGGGQKCLPAVADCVLVLLLGCVLVLLLGCVLVLLLGCVLVLLLGLYCLLTANCVLVLLLGLYCLLTCQLCSCTVAWLVLSTDLPIVFLYCCLACTV